MLSATNQLQFAAYEGDLKYPLLHLVINGYDGYVDRSARPLVFMYGQVKLVSLSGFDWDNALPPTYLCDIGMDTGNEREVCVLGCVDEPIIVQVCKEFFQDVAAGTFSPRVVFPE